MNLILKFIRKSNTGVVQIVLRTVHDDRDLFSQIRCLSLVYGIIEVQWL